MQREPSVAVLSALLLASCGTARDPPGRMMGDSAGTAATTAIASSPALPPSASAGDEARLPDKIASIAMRTWIYQEAREDAHKLGYLRAGAVVARAAAPAGTRDCAGGWYRIEPRGYVCAGKGASLDVAHPVVKAAAHGPQRGDPFPYRYVISREPAPHLYLKLPSEDEQRTAEGKRRDRSVALFAHSARTQLGPADPIPEMLRDGSHLPKPYGAEAPLAYRAHRGRARAASAFGLIASYDWQGRPFGLTTELDLIPLDRVRVAAPSQLRGIPIDRAGTPAFVTSFDAPLYEMRGGVLRQKGTAAHRSGWILTGKHNGSPQGLLETSTGGWLAAGTLRIAELREDPAGFALQGSKWIDVSIGKQMLVAYQGRQPVYAALVSSGRGEMGDPEKTTATVRGTFMIASKHISGTMDGDEKTREAFDLRDVPYIQYFYQGYALHGAYWHNDFGKVKSHGCINLAPADAAWLFEWTDPNVPDGWHGAHNPAHGTLLYIHR